MNKKASQKRLALILLGVGLLLAFCIYKAIVTVRVNGAEYTQKTLNQASGSRTSIMAQPGSIVDSNGTYLAVTKIVYRLILDPKVMAQSEKLYPGTMEKTIELMVSVFGLDENDLVRAFTDDITIAYLRYKGNTILSEQQVNAWNQAVENFQKEKTEYNKKVAEKEDRMTARIAGVWFEQEYRREYPLDSILSKVVGYTTVDAQEGITGLEKYYDDVLRGTDGYTYTYIDGEGNSVTNVSEPENGKTLVTSLDANVARILQDCIKQYQEEIGGERINVLVMDPNNGEIVAMASDTDFDLNEPSDLTPFFSYEELLHPEETFLLREAFKNKEDQLEEMSYEEKLLALRQQVQLNFAISGTFEPGSTSKSLTLAACIEEGVLEEESLCECTHEIQVANYIIHCHGEEPCGTLNTLEALGNSCNVCFVKYGLQLGAKRLAKYQELLNLGQKTGIDLPGEANTQYLIYNENTFTDIDIAVNAFGQGYNLTMLQMAAAYSSLINGGYYYEPHVVKQIVDLEGNVVEEAEPVVVRRTVSKSTSEYIKKALRFVITNGTAVAAGKEGYLIGGKTGAAEKLPRGTDDYIVSFISAAPINEPRYLVYVVIDTPHVENQSASMPAVILSHNIWDELYDYFKIYSESDEDAFSYDWSKLRDFSGGSDEQDPSGIIVEIPEETPTPGDEAAVQDTAPAGEAPEQ